MCEWVRHGEQEQVAWQAGAVTVRRAKLNDATATATSNTPRPWIHEYVFPFMSRKVYAELFLLNSLRPTLPRRL